MLLPDDEYEKVQWAFLHSVMYGSKKDLDQHGRFLKTIHAPFTSTPFKFPIEQFRKAERLAKPFNTLIDAVSNDYEWIKNVLKYTVENDAFTARLMEVFDLIHNEGAHQTASFGINRSDYMLPSAANDDRNLLQVEINTISSSFGALSTRISELLRYFNTNDDIPLNHALTGISDSIAAAHKLFVSKSLPASEPAIVFVVQPNEKNFCDQRLLHYELTGKHKLNVIRATFADLHREGSLGDDFTFHFRGQVVSVIYFRCGYSPDDYLLSGTDSEWEARLMVERSTAIKCPNIGYHLAGTKKVQQELSRPGVLEYFLLTDKVRYDVELLKQTHEDIALLRSVFAGLYSLDPTDAQDIGAVKQRAIDSPDSFVLKPQREGGGNNIYHEELAHALRTLSDVELSAFILMEKIQPPAQPAKLIRECLLYEVCFRMQKKC